MKKQQHCLPLQRSVKFKASTHAKENFAEGQKNQLLLSFLA